LPVADPAFAISSYIYACKVNSKTRFLLELQNIVEESNHVFVQLVKDVTEGGDDASTSDDDGEESPSSKQWVVKVGDRD
jgi:hypothetical protein